MKLNKTRFVFTIVIFICWFTLSVTNVILEFPNYVDNSLQQMSKDLCKNDMVQLNFSNAVISIIRQDFISSPLITCLDLTNNNIEIIEEGAFDTLPNLTQLYFSNNKFKTSEKLFAFGGHEKLKILVLNEATHDQYYDRCKYGNYEKPEIFGEYPDLEILVVRDNCFADLWAFSEEISSSDLSFARFSKITQIPFPKLKILDLSGNYMGSTNFVKLLSDNLRFLDLHNNKLDSLNLNKTGNKLFALNLDNNYLKNVRKWYDPYNSGLVLTGLENLHYLSIFKNKIDVIEPSAFEDTNELMYLNLSRNYINNLHSETFAKLKSLHTLDLSFNKLPNVPQISSEININILFLNCNNITKLTSNAFVQISKLTKLLLGGNEINEIDVKAFAHLLILEKLDLSRNKLSSLPEGWTEPFVSLKYLDLSDNKFTSLESLSLTSTLSLVDLYLAMNQLEYLNIKYLENLPQDLTVNLTHRSDFTHCDYFKQEKYRNY